MNKAGKIINLTHMQQRIDLTENWIKDNPVLLEGEIGYETQTQTDEEIQPPKGKVGDGKTAWNDLPYYNSNSASGTGAVTVLGPVTVEGGAEKRLTYPKSKKVLTQVYEVVPDSSNLSGGVDSYTKLMAHLNKDFVDSSFNPKAVTNNGVSIDTVTQKFGDGCAYFNGNGYLSYEYSSDFSLGDKDFTYSAYINPSNLNGYQSICGIWNYPCSFDIRTCSQDVGGNVAFLYSTNGSNSTVLSMDYKLPRTNAWLYFEMVRSGSSLLLFIDGKLVSKKSLTATIYELNQNLCFGRTDSRRYYTGYINEAMLSVGIARHTADYTPPTAPNKDGTFFECANVGTFSDDGSRYGLRVDDSSSLIIKNKDTSSHTVTVYVTPVP